MTDLSKVRWEPDCGCKIELREYRITRDMQCECHHADGTVKKVPLRVATIEEMAASGKKPEFWEKCKAANPNGRAHVCPDGCTYRPGTRIKGRLTHRCEAHRDLDDDNLQSQVADLDCGCRVRQITTGEGRCGDKATWLTQTIKRCPAHG